MWKLGNTDLIQFGLIPSMVDGSNIAVSGNFDLPARVGKTGHDWGADESGVEPYVLEEEIRLMGRDIVFVALLKAENEKSALLKCYELYNLLGSSTTLVDFITPYGTYSVYIKDSITAEYAGDGLCKMKITLREPVVSFTDEMAVPDNANLGIDGVSFENLGLIPLDVTGRFGNPKHKEYKATGFDTEAFKVMPTENREVTVKALIDCANLADFKSYLNKLYNLLRKEGLRYITYRNDMFRMFFVKDGVQILNISELSDGRVIAVLLAKFMEVNALDSTDWGFLLSDTEQELTDILGEKIIVIPETVEESESDLYVNVSNYTIDAASTEGEYPIQVLSNTNWVILDNTSWLEVTDSAGVGNGTIYIQVEAYTGTVQREAYITLQSPAGTKKITVRQGVGAVLTVDKTSIVVSPNGGTNTIVIQSNTSWAITENANWLSVTPSSGTGNATVTVSVDATAVDRNTPVNVTGANITRTVQVSQAIEIVVVGDGTGILADFPLPVEDHWNNFRPDVIPDFEIPKKLDAKTGEVLPVKGIVWHAPYRNIFGANDVEQLTKMFKKGFTAINASKLPPYYAGMENLITGDRIVVDGNLARHGGERLPEEQSYEAFANFATACFGWAEMYHIPKDSSNRYKVFLTMVDYESSFTKLDNQEDANFHVVAFDAGVKRMTGRYMFMYASALNTFSFNQTRNYNGQARSAWGVSADGSVPVELRGKSLASSNRNAGCVEISYSFETMLPQGYQAKDQNGNDWIMINHFGGEVNGQTGYQSIPNTEHWATQLGLIEAVYAEHRANGQELIAQIKPTNEKNDGFKYSAAHPEWQDGKWIQEYNRYGIQYFVGTNSYLGSVGSEYVPNFIAEGQVYLSYFCGARWLNWWSSAWSDTAVPRTKVGNNRRGNREDDKTYGNADLESYTYTMKAAYQLSRKIVVKNGGGVAYSFYEICDGTEEYLLWNTKVIYPNSSSVQQLNAVAWQVNRRSPVRAVVNKNLNVVFVLAFQAYGAEDSTVTFVYNDDGANVLEVINIPANTYVIAAYALVGTITPPPTLIPPVIIANVNPVIAGASVTFSTVSTGAISWYKNGASINQTGASYTVTSPVTNDYYTAVRTVGGITSAQSNSISVVGSSGIIITEPAKPPYYFSDGHPPSYYDNNAHLPAIFQNTPHYDADNDIVWMSNGIVKAGINLKRGGQLMWVSEIGSTENLVYNGYDGGFQITMDAYQKPDGYTQNGQVSSGLPNGQGDIRSYNTTQGGDYYNHSQKLIAYKRVGDSYVVKFRPIFYTMNSEFSEVIMEITYSLVGRAVKMDVKYTSFRTDGQQNGSSGFDGAAFPACFIVNTLNRYQVYTGSSPFTNAAVEDGQLPIQNQGQSPLGRDVTEKWSLVYRQNDNKAIGIYVPTSDVSMFSTLKQLDVYPQNSAGTEFWGGFTYFDIFQYFTGISGNRGNYTTTKTAYIATGTKEQVRQQFYDFRNGAMPIN